MKTPFKLSAQYTEDTWRIPNRIDQLRSLSFCSICWHPKRNYYICNLNTPSPFLHIREFNLKVWSHLCSCKKYIGSIAMQSQSIFSNTLVCRGLAAEQRTLCGDLEKILEVITLKRKMHRKLNLAGDGIKILKKKPKASYQRIGVRYLPVVTKTFGMQQLLSDFQTVYTLWKSKYAFPSSSKINYMRMYLKFEELVYRGKTAAKNASNSPGLFWTSRSAAQGNACYSEETALKCKIAPP